MDFGFVNLTNELFIVYDLLIKSFYVDGGEKQSKELKDNATNGCGRDILIMKGRFVLLIAHLYILHARRRVFTGGKDRKIKLCLRWDFLC